MIQKEWDSVLLHAPHNIAAKAAAYTAKIQNALLKQQQIYTTENSRHEAKSHKYRKNEF